MGSQFSTLNALCREYANNQGKFFADWVDVFGRLTTAGWNLNPINNNNNALHGHRFFITCKKSGKVWDMGGANRDNGGQVIQWGKHGGANQRWLIENGTGGCFTIKNVNSGKALDVPGGANTQGLQLIQWDFHGGDNQQWIFESKGVNTFAIRAKQSKLALDVNGGSMDDGGKIIQWEFHGGDNQLWVLSRAEE